jgi:hypothetical protein
MKQNAEPYELVYTVKREDDLYSPLREGNMDRLDEEMKAASSSPSRSCWLTASSRS